MSSLGFPEPVLKKFPPSWTCVCVKSVLFVGHPAPLNLEVMSAPMPLTRFGLVKYTSDSLHWIPESEFLAPKFLATRRSLWSRISRTHSSTLPQHWGLAGIHFAGSSHFPLKSSYSFSCSAGAEGADVDCACAPRQNRTIVNRTSFFMSSSSGSRAAFAGCPAAHHVVQRH